VIDDVSSGISVKVFIGGDAPSGTVGYKVSTEDEGGR